VHTEVILPTSLHKENSHMINISALRRKLTSLIVLAVFVFGVTAARTQTQTTSQGSVPVTGGTLSWTITSYLNEACGSSNHFSVYVDTLFVLTVNGTAYPATPAAGTAYLESPGTAVYCPTNGPDPANPVVLDFANGYVIDFYIENGGGGTATVIKQ
jgi:hypothetical protein